MGDFQRVRMASIAVVEASTARALVQPFAQPLGKWHERAALISARMLARATLTDDQQSLVDQVHALADEVKRGHAQLHAATRQSAPHSYIDDVDKAYGQLLETLETLSAKSRVL